MMETDNDTKTVTKSNTHQCSNKCKDRKTKVNKNAVLRIRKKENPNTNSQLPGNTEKLQTMTQLSSPDLDGGDADSAIGSDVASFRSMSFEYDEIPNEMRNLNLHPNNESSSENYSGFANFPQTHSGEPKVIVQPPSPRQTALFQHNKVQPVSEAPPISAFQQELTVSENVRTDGPQSDMFQPNTDDTIPTSIQPSINTSVDSFCSRDGMSDVVILHTDADMEAVCVYKDHLCNDIGIPDLTVDLFSSIDAGKTQFMSLETLHDKYRFVLTYVTENLENDRYSRFLQEILITCGLKEANGKEDRVVPVFTKKGDCNIIEIKVLNGFQYFKFHSESQVVRKYYLESVKKYIKKQREKFP